MGSYMETLGNRAKAASREAAALGTEEKKPRASVRSRGTMPGDRTAFRGK